MKVSLFGSKFARQLLCAVPESAKIPAFLVEAGWTLLGIRDHEQVPALARVKTQTLERVGHVIVPRRSF